MGDRAVFGFRTHKDAPTLYLYGHWAGEKQDRSLAIALAKSTDRWGDDAYATRIAVSHIIGDAWDKETGYGLTIDEYAYPDYDYINVVDWNARKVYRMTLHDDDMISDEGTGFNTFITNNLKGELVTFSINN
jgi:hypothetical protein